MERLRRGLVFWVLLLVSIAMPAAGQSHKKTIFQASIKAGDSSVGGSMLQLKTSGWEVLTRTTAYPNHSVTKVALRMEGDSREIILCQNGATAADDCTYLSNGNLDLESIVNGTALYLAGITGLEFYNALIHDHLVVELNYGALGAGTFYLWLSH